LVAFFIYSRKICIISKNPYNYGIHQNKKNILTLTKTKKMTETKKPAAKKVATKTTKAAKPAVKKA